MLCLFQPSELVACKCLSTRPAQQSPWSRISLIALALNHQHHPPARRCSDSLGSRSPLPSFSVTPALHAQHRQASQRREKMYTATKKIEATIKKERGTVCTFQSRARPPFQVQLHNVGTEVPPCDELSPSVMLPLNRTTSTQGRGKGGRRRGCLLKWLLREVS